MFGAIKNIGNNLRLLDRNAMIREIVSQPLLQAQIIDLNQKQLYEQGVDSNGVSTGEYSLATIYGTSTFEGKIEKDQPYDHVTLKDSAESYDSMKVVTEDSAFIVTGDFPDAIKSGWPHALGLTDESVKEILPEFKDRMIDNLKRDILK